MEILRSSHLDEPSEFINQVRYQNRFALGLRVRKAAVIVEEVIQTPGGQYYRVGDLGLALNPALFPNFHPGSRLVVTHPLMTATRQKQ